MTMLAAITFYFLVSTDATLLQAYGPGPRFSDLETCESARHHDTNGAPANAYACVPLVVPTHLGIGGSGMTGGRGGYLGPCGAGTCQ